MKSQRLTAFGRVGSVFMALFMVLGLVLLGSPARPVAAQTPPPTPFDLMLVIDGSDSISAGDFKLARDFASTLVNSCLFVSGSRAGVVQFSAPPAVLQQSLTDNRDEILASLATMTQLRRSTYTNLGIDLAQAHLNANRRPGVKNFIIVLTDGASTDRSATRQSANAARAAGSELFAIGVGPITSISDAELQDIANPPSATIPKYVFRANDFPSLEALLAPVVGAVCGVAVVPIDAPVVETLPADVWVVNRPNPNHGTPAGSVITTQIVTKNIGEGLAKDVRITVPFDPNELRLLDANFSSKAAWVSSVVTNSLTINTGGVAARGGVITSTLRFQVLENLGPDVALGERLSFTWFDAGRGGSGKGNMPILTTGGSVDHRPTYSLNVSPANTGAAGTRFTFASNIFASNEPVGVWYNMPDGTSVRSVGTFRANADGSLSVNFNAPSTLAPGNYSMVFYGLWTEFSAVGNFTITR
jgi:hypothetical protein